MSFWLSENPVEIESDENNEIRAVSSLCNIFYNVSYERTRQAKQIWVT